MKKNIASFAVICSIILGSYNVSSQVVGTDIYMKGTSVEIGINGSGGHEGARTTINPPPPGMHQRGSSSLFGFVANPQVNLWAQFNGDFYTPGSSENGWGIQVGSLQKGNNAAPLLEIPLGTTNYSHILDCKNTDVSGSLLTGTLSLGFNIHYFLGQNDLFYTTTVSITNNSINTIPLMYYYRSFDPDNNQSAPGGSFSTVNTIENQTGSGIGCTDLACVSASQALPWPSYVALAGIGADFKVTKGGFSNRSAANIWNAVAPLNGVAGTTSTADEAISLAYRIQNFLPGTTRTFKFVVILRASDKSAALSNLLTLSYPGSSVIASTVTACSAVQPPDTVRLCGPSAIVGPVGPTSGYYNWAWSPTVFLSSPSTPTAVVSPTVLTTYTITGVPTSTCVSSTNITYTVVVIPSPTVTALPGMLAGSAFTVGVNAPITICAGSPFNLSSYGGGAGASFLWTGPSGYSSSIPSPSMAVSSPTSIGTYTILVSAINGCTGSTTTTVNFVNTTTIAVTPTTTVCQGGALSITANALGATYYSWAGPLGYTSSVQNPTISTSALVSQTGIYTVTASFVVGTSTCTTFNTCTVNVMPSVPAALAPIPTVCNNGTINLVSPAGGTSYSWVGPNSFVSAVQNPNIINATPMNNGTYTVSITTGGCTNSGTVIINVYTALSYTALPTNITLCEGKSGNISGSGIGGSGTHNYTWYPLTGLDFPNSFSTNVIGYVTTIYTLTLTDANCIATLPVYTTVTVNVNPTPVITMTTSNNRGCEPFFTDLVSSSVPASANCQWRFTNSLASGNCNSTTFLFPTHGTYGATLTVTDINGCVDSVKNNAFILVDPKPNADFGWTPDNPNIYSNEISFLDQSTIGLPITNWHWDFGDVFVGDVKDTSNIQNPTHLYENVSTYTVSLTVINKFGCTDDVIKLLKVEDNFVVYIPNSFTPSGHDGNNDVFKVSGVGFLSESFEMSIYDRWGTLIFKTNDINKGWDGSVKGVNVAKHDTYVYKIKLKDYKNKEREFVGHVTIL